ncbi:MAG TPA: nuclear transport factor 2 family protein [Acidimicrobiales bacterium]
MPTYTEAEQRNIDAVNAMFEAGPELDRVTLFADDAVWWNGLPLLPGAVGETEHRGIDAIRRILHGSGRSHPGTGIDSYDLRTNRFTDVLVLADGDHVVRQHTQHSTTLGGRPYRNVYCFVFRFDAEGRITYLTEHWNTWYAHKVLFENFPVEPAHPTGEGG